MRSFWLAALGTLAAGALLLFVEYRYFRKGSTE